MTEKTAAEHGLSEEEAVQRLAVAGLAACVAQTREARLGALAA
jgi:hypothetical protein